MSKGTIDYELDDCSYILDYDYERPRRETRWEPREGGIQVDRLTLVLDGYDGPIHIDVTEHSDNLRVMDRLIELAQRESREIA